MSTDQTPASSRRRKFGAFRMAAVLGLAMLFICPLPIARYVERATADALRQLVADGRLPVARAGEISFDPPNMTLTMTDVTVRIPSPAGDIDCTAERLDAAFTAQAMLSMLPFSQDLFLQREGTMRLLTAATLQHPKLASPEMRLAADEAVVREVWVDAAAFSDILSGGASAGIVKSAYVAWTKLTGLAAHDGGTSLEVGRLEIKEKNGLAFATAEAQDVTLRPWGTDGAAVDIAKVNLEDVTLPDASAGFPPAEDTSWVALLVAALPDGPAQPPARRIAAEKISLPLGGHTLACDGVRIDHEESSFGTTMANITLSPSPLGTDASPLRMDVVAAFRPMGNRAWGFEASLAADRLANIATTAVFPQAVEPFAKSLPTLPFKDFLLRIEDRGGTAQTLHGFNAVLVAGLLLPPSRSENVPAFEALSAFLEEPGILEVRTSPGMTMDMRQLARSFHDGTLGSLLRIENVREAQDGR